MHAGGLTNTCDNNWTFLDLSRFTTRFLNRFEVKSGEGYVKHANKFKFKPARFSKEKRISCLSSSMDVAKGDLSIDRAHTSGRLIRE
jgi:hypothetical protein